MLVLRQCGINVAKAYWTFWMIVQARIFFWDNNHNMIHWFSFALVCTL